MRARAAVAWVAACCVLGAGCSPKFQATWYLGAPPEQQSGATQRIYLLLVNQSQKTQNVDDVVINQDDQGAHWQLKSGPVITLAAGEALVRSSEDFEWFDPKAISEGNVVDKQDFLQACRLPMSISVITHDGTTSANLNGRMPSSLPQGWETGCLHKAGGQSGAAPSKR